MPRLLLALLMLTACNEVNSQFCDNPEHKNDPHCMMGMKCTSRDMCTMSGLPVCDLTDNGGTCVACTATDMGACNGMTPICSTDRTCVACSTDMECKGVCLPNGSCAMASDLIYVKPAGDTNQQTCGTSAANACELQTALMIAAGATTRNVLLLASGTYSATGAGWTATGGSPTIDARATVELVHQTGDGPPITVMGGAHVTLLGGHVHGGSGISGNGITVVNSTLSVIDAKIDMNAAVGIRADGGSTINVARSSFTMNDGGAIDVSGKFVIVNNFIYNNGAQLSTIGGVHVATGGDSGNQLDFNTIVRNLAQSGPGINCDAGVFTARNNIIWKNAPMNGSDQVSGSCKHAYSDLSTAVMANQDGGNNVADDPLLMNELLNPHLQGTSPVKAKADPNATMAVDIDGQARPQPMGAPADIGADEIP